MASKTTVDMAKWDARHRAAEESLAEPASIVLELLPLLPQGPALDLACGTGRHALLLAAQGRNVTAVDASGVALGILEERAHAAMVPLSRVAELNEVRRAAGTGVQLVQEDLERAQLPAASFDLILCLHYLQRSLFAQMERALRPGGMLLFETYTRAQLAFAGGLRNADFLLENHELRGAFPKLRTIFHRELRAGKGIASLLAQKPV
jgi:tellurite methyltransferase